MKGKSKVSLSFSEISSRLQKVALPPIDHVVGIARGGIVPACTLAHQLQCELTILRINYRNDDNRPRYEVPQNLSSTLPDLSHAHSLLLVDDVSVSGKTLALAKQLLNHPRVYTFTLKGKADFVLFPEVNSCVNWPWNA